MTLAASDPVAEHAWEAGKKHGAALRTRRPRPIEAWRFVNRISPWLHDARRAAVDAEPAASTAAEWLLDNGYLVQRAMLLVLEDMPAGFYARLRPLALGQAGSEPRILMLAHDLLTATHFQLSRESVLAYLEGYQDHDPLDIAELWALPAMLRIACLERLVAGFALTFPTVRAPFELSASCRPFLNSCDPVESISRAIANLGVISNISWNDVFDASSRVERVLVRDPVGTYPTMDFETRDACRRSVERVAGQSRCGELIVAENALKLAMECRELPGSHVGYWLLGQGVPALELHCGATPRWSTQIVRWLMRHPGGVYTCAILLCGLIGLGLPAAYLSWNNATALQWVLGMAFSAIPATVLSVTAVNWIVTLTVAPRQLAKLDFSTAIDPAWPTLVAMPVIVGSVDEVPMLLARLEAHRLSNPGASGYVLLSDPGDAATERTSDDDLLEDVLSKGIAGLNRRHGESCFYLLHRARRFNPAQGCWMAWERKRGKIEQFNDLLLSGDATAFPVTVGLIDRLAGAKLVVTADADTRLPPGSVARLAGTMAHPLNRPVFNARGAVISGYTVMQPRVEIAPHGSESLFARLFGGDTAIDIYSRAVSDVYQDLVGAGNYVGKGIYDVTGFARSLQGRIPENQLLSHDLWEGLHGRAALVTDVIVYESFPASYGEHSQRLHRWVRGDWQLLPWLFNQVPGPDGMRLQNRLSLFDRLRIWDNMRRSLVPASVLGLLLAGWLLLPGSPVFWTLMALAAPGASLFTDLVTGLARGRRRGVLVGTMREAGEHLGRWALQVTFLLSDTVTAIHAISVTMLRMRRGQHLLEWTSAAHVSLNLAGSHRAGQWNATWTSPVLAIFILPLLALDAHALPLAAPLILLWLVAPEIAWLSGRPRHQAQEHLDEEARQFLRKVARRTWLFFEHYVRPEDHWLPPDNHQEEPTEITAHRTSPTNIGMMALSALSAWRMGHLGSPEFVERMRTMLDTLDRLERWHGHILNWYDTSSLTPLEPRYVSTVDSGNLAVSLVVLAEGCRRIRKSPIITPGRWDGLEDSLLLLTEALERASVDSSLPKQVRKIIADCHRARESPLRWSDVLRTSLIGLATLRADLAEALARLPTPPTRSLVETRDWIERSEHHLKDCQRDIDGFMPWLARLHVVPPGCQDLADKVQETLRLDAALSDSLLLARNMDAVQSGYSTSDPSNAGRKWLTELNSASRRGLARWRRLERALERIAQRAETMADGMNFAPLYAADRKLFHIGYDVSAQRLDPHFYDLLASEARLASYFAIAKHDAPPEHWFQLGRPIVKHGQGLALVSWNGSMFEYLMPSLFLRSDPATLLGESETSAVAIQRQYGTQRGVPWGISESGFGSTGSDGSWRYRAFGVPELGLRRGLEEDLVIAPYATALALAARPLDAAANLRRLASNGALGRFGFHEALDFTPERVSDAHAPVKVASYMSHHQGMTIAAIANALHSDFLVEWFHADARIGTVDLLLNERVPWELPAELERLDPLPSVPIEGGRHVRHQPWEPQDRPSLPVHLLGNGRLSLRISTDGSSELSWKDQALTRPAGIAQSLGHFFYLRDRSTGQVWSPAAATFHGGNEPQVIFHAHKVEFRCRAGPIIASLEVFVSPSDDVEIRRLRLINTSSAESLLDFSSYAEVALATSGEWLRHPAFARLFVEAETHDEIDALLFARRPRETDLLAPVMVQRIIASGPEVRITGTEVARSRSHDRMADAADIPHFPKVKGARTRFPLDPAATFGAEISLLPNGEAQLAMITVAGNSREETIDLARRYGSLSSLDWAEQDAAAHVSRELAALDLPPTRLEDAEALFSALVARTGPHSPNRSSGREDTSRDALWAMGISGDLPILLMEVSEEFDGSELRFVIAAHRLWRWRGALVDLVLLHPGLPGYVEPLRERMLASIRLAGSDDLLGDRGGIHILGSQQAETRVETLRQAALARITSRGGPILTQLRAAVAETNFVPEFVAVGRVPLEEPGGERRETVEPLTFTNPHGGFTPDGDYRIELGPMEATPALWANVLANPGFGCIVTEAGLGFTFAGNAGENRLTPWHNDPLRDPQGEVVYLRDEETAEIWSITPLPAGRDAACRVEHGPGETVWSRQSASLDQEMRCFVAPDDPVKIIQLQLTDRLGKARRITATCFVEWLLGALANDPAPFRHSWYEPELTAILAQNNWQTDFKDRVAFLAGTGAPHSLTTSRSEFLGQPPNWRFPAGLRAWDLGDRLANQGPDAAAALQLHLDIPANGTITVAFLLGQAEQVEYVEDLLARWRPLEAQSLGNVHLKEAWDRRFSACQVITPDPAFDLMVNRWLPYQTVSSRLFARAGYYQASGAFGFRDQLQDVLALIMADPALVRDHILSAAAHQFEAGDVLHWWHPPSGKGVRTRCSDDLLWLPHAVAHYVLATGDTGILDARVPFLEASELRSDEHDRFNTFHTGTHASLYEHCLCAFDRAFRLGEHALPLMGDGDWNDGMNRVGVDGRGESVWLAWFLIATIRDFARMSEAAGRPDFSPRWLPRADQLVAAIDRNAWDGAWYVRAFDDQGRAWGSQHNDECRIDSLAQSWAVIAGCGAEDRANEAIDNAFNRLVRANDRIVRLLDPPFDATVRDPGYIKAYPPGVRENGGQYSHAAAWLGIACAMQGNGERAKEIFDRINPLTHAGADEAVQGYAIEPYVVAGDISGLEGHVGRGGWSWYTGAAAWTWRLAVEHILGIRLETGKIALSPCLPSHWPGYSATLRGDGVIKIVVQRGHARSMLVDGQLQDAMSITFPGSGVTRTVELIVP